jgi:uncharacterized protein (AIM24 family)
MTNTLNEGSVLTRKRSRNNNNNIIQQKKQVIRKNKNVTNSQLTPYQKPKQNPPLSNKNLKIKKLKNNYIRKLNYDIIFLVVSPIQTKNSNLCPDYQYEGGEGFKCVKFNLKKGEEIRSEGGAMNYIKNDIEIETKSNGFFSSIFRTFSGSSFFFNIFRNVSDKPGSVTFSGVNPGDIGCFYIPSGKKFNFVSDTYICSTTNLNINTNIRFGGLLLGYGLTFVQVESSNNNPGLIWISSFGRVTELILEPGESAKIDNGVLLGFDADININTEFVGGIMSTLFSGEGIISKIININQNKKISIFLQGRSKIQYIRYIQTISKQKK